MADPQPIPGALLESIRDGLVSLGEIGGNRLLDYDPVALAGCALLDGKCIAIDVTDLDFSLYLHPARSGIRLGQSSPGREVDARIAGSLGALIALALQQDKRSTAISEGIHFSGDIALAQKLERILAEVDIDWEEMLARRCGDVAAHQLASGLRSFGQGLRAAAESLGNSTGEYLREEARLVPTRPEFDRFARRIGELRNDVARIEARLERLLAARRQG